MGEEFQDEPAKASKKKKASKPDYSPPPATPDMPVEVVVYSAAYTRRMNRLKICLLITYILIVTFVILVRKDVIGKDTAANVKSSVTDLFDRDKDKDKNPPPPASTPSIDYPTVADTYIRGEEFADTSFGSYDTFRVQGSGAKGQPAAYALLQFDLSDIPPPRTTEDGISKREFWLELDHVESLAPEDQTHKIQVIRLPDLGVNNLESVTLNTFPSTLDQKEAEPKFRVTESDASIQVEITSLIEEASSRLLRRKLAPADTTIFLMLKSLDSDGAASVFRSRQAPSVDQHPKIVLYLPPTPVPTLAPTPRPTESPATPAPTPRPPTDPPITPPPTHSPPTEPPTTPSPTPRPPTNPPVTAAPVQPATPLPTMQPVVTSSPRPSPPPVSTPLPSKAPIQPPTDSPSPQPTVSPRPSASPTSCGDYVSPFLIPPLVNTDGAIQNAFPEGAVSYVFQEGSQVTVRISQLWSDENVAWIAPYFIVLSQGGFVCPKTRDISPGSTLEATLDCFNTEVVFRVLVNDASLIPEDDDSPYELPPECRQEDDDLPGQIVLYTFLVKCNPPPVECNGNA